MKLKVFLLTMLPVLVVCCQNKPRPDEDAATVDADDGTTHIALVRTLASLPVAYAEEYGMFGKQGLPVTIEWKASPDDCDTALVGKHVFAAAVNAPRLDYLCRQGMAFDTLATTHCRWGILSPALLRLQHVRDLKGRIVATSRRSTAEEVCHEILQQAKMKTSDIAEPRIANYDVLLNMIMNNQVDAAVMPEPYFTQGHLQGARILAVGEQTVLKRGYIVCRKTAIGTNGNDISLKFKRAYNEAIDSLANGQKEKWQALLQQTYGLDAKTIAKISLPKYQKAQ